MKIDKIQLIEYIKDHEDCTSKTLASYFSVSTKTIKNYIKNINAEHPYTIISSYNGYRANSNNIEAIKNNNDEILPQTSQERISYVLNELLQLEEDEQINEFDICDELYISLSTLKNDLEKIKGKISNYNLTLYNKKNYVSLIGDEYDKRKLIGDLLYEESSNNFVDYPTIQKKFPNIDIIFIRNVFINCLDESGYFINDYSLTNLVLHAAISLDRIINKNVSLKEKQEKLWINEHVYKITREVVKQIEQYFSVEYDDIEKYELALLIMSRSVPVDYNNLENSNVSKYIKEENLVLASEVIKEIKKTYDIDLGDEKSIYCFALHLQSLFVRSNNNSLNKNPLTNEIKTACPFFFDAAVHISSLIKKKTGIMITDDEISYIAIHLGFMIGEKKSSQSKISTIIYCPKYYNAIQNLIKKLNDLFTNDLTIINVITSEEQIDSLRGVDLVLSILPINTKNIDTIQISLFLDDKDITEIRKQLSIIKSKKKKKIFEEKLHQLLPASLFFRENSFSSPYQCIKYMCSKLVEQNYADNNLIDEIMERETLSSTSFGPFAIPHSTYMNSKRTTISVMICDKPINWNNNKVSLVIMMYFNKKDRKDFQSFYETISSVLIENENISKLIECNSYDGFISQFVDCLGQ